MWLSWIRKKTKKHQLNNVFKSISDNSNRSIGITILTTRGKLALKIMAALAVLLYIVVAVVVCCGSTVNGYQGLKVCIINELHLFIPNK